jgi:uncharacterized phage protein (TIGR01671 family)
VREIIFRGKSIDTDKWVFGDFVSDVCGISHEEYLNEYGEVGYIGTYVIPETVGQYTGLTDKNGKKIFEGDIVTADVYEREYEDEYLSNIPIEVTCCGGYFYPFHLEGCWRSGVSNIEIIGNIHDNPELLKEGAE